MRPSRLPRHAMDASFWRDERVRAVAAQVLAFAAVVAVFAWLVTNTAANLDRLNIRLTLGFFDERAGFNILQTPIPYDNNSTYLRAFLVGLVNTLIVGVIGVILATILGFLVGIGRLSSNWLLARLATIYVETFRNIPLLLQLVFWAEAVLTLLPRAQQAIELPFGATLSVRGLYLPAPVAESALLWVGVAFLAGIAAAYLLGRWARGRQARTGQRFPAASVGLALIFGLPILTFLVLGRPLAWEPPVLQRFNFTGGIPIIPELAALVLGLVIYTAAFIAEVVRGGILAVPRGQIEAARAVGLSSGTTMRRVIIPQALRAIIPPLTNQYLNLIKNSSLAVAIGYPDLVGVFKNTVLNQTGRAIEVVAITMAVYLFISLAGSVFMNRFNARVAIRER
ncbi:MAG: amino acid ABC transporter permease [Bauldia sp.]|nr:amino acid ABC transporter permease [Bauldia sp.]